jgi:hypothetical protein
MPTTIAQQRNCAKRLNRLAFNGQLSSGSLAR